MDHAGIGADLEGIHAVAAALEAGRVTRLTVERNRLKNPDVGRVVEVASEQSIRIEQVDDVRPLAVTGAPQGIVAKARPIDPISLKQAVQLTDNPALLVLDHIEDPRNVGAVARSGVAFGMTGLVLSGRRSAPLGATAFKAAAGALERIPIVVVSSIGDALKRLDQLGLWRVGLEGGADRLLLGLDLLAQPVALCIGAEGTGLSHLVADRCDVLVSIPMVGATESLNVSVASALASFEVARVRGWVS
ncbi:MAG: 23S rRNA (guanosine(2251)-2'-O)-methyltransferase RlmB [Acidimicrobiia bacterium]|nr:MAG: 23S rRNA (guanosine(2251)-2'-O)-methyltransferase RlmB [Acidimicrobiia bacterium]